jgi:hypothetical protein
MMRMDVYTFCNLRTPIATLNQDIPSLRPQSGSNSFGKRIHALQQLCSPFNPELELFMREAELL